jgi:hypothetical protein
MCRRQGRPDAIDRRESIDGVEFDRERLERIRQHSSFDSIRIGDEDVARPCRGSAWAPAMRRMKTPRRVSGTIDPAGVFPEAM